MSTTRQATKRYELTEAARRWQSTRRRYEPESRYWQGQGDQLQREEALVTLMRYLENPALPIDNNFDKQQIQFCATNRKNRLLAEDGTVHCHRPSRGAHCAPPILASLVTSA
ncbi:transposase [Variovorax sp. 770b2]|uniref:IS66 family transposase n=1 Tax=Variovorax sp. 770b2 TaxID=1566271 RepID=UPI0011604130